MLCLCASSEGVIRFWDSKFKPDATGFCLDLACCFVIGRLEIWKPFLFSFFWFIVLWLLTANEIKVIIPHKPLVFDLI